MDLEIFLKQNKVQQIYASLISVILTSTSSLVCNTRLVTQMLMVKSVVELKILSDSGGKNYQFSTGL
jgi:hypothetical protein